MSIKPLEYIEKKVERLEGVLAEIKSEIRQLEYVEKGYDIKRLLYDEKYRFEVAIKETGNNTQLAELLKISERTVYRLRKKWKLE